MTDEIGLMYTCVAFKGKSPLKERKLNMYKLIFKNTKEELVFETLEEAKMCRKLSVMVNNDKRPIHRDSKRNYEIVEIK